MTPEGTADGPDVAAWARTLFDHDSAGSTGGRRHIEAIWLMHRGVYLARARALAPHFAAVTAQRDQYAAQVARVEAVMASGPRCSTTYGDPERTCGECLRCRLRAALRADGGGGE